MAKKKITRKPVAKKKSLPKTITVKIPKFVDTTFVDPEIGELPARTIMLSTFDELAALAKRFFKGSYPLVILIGRPGISKSFSCETYINDHPGKAVIIEGNISPVMIYVNVWEYKDMTLIMDDTDSAMVHADGRFLIRQLTGKSLEKTVSWQKASHILNNHYPDAIPRKFTTKSNVLIIGNKFKFGKEAETAAIVDRAGVVYYFNPSAWEVHRFVATWFGAVGDQDVFNYIADRLYLTYRHSIRAYTKTQEEKNAGGDWKAFFENGFCAQGQARIVAQLMHDASYAKDEDRVEAFIRKTGSCRATYYNVRKRLLSSGHNYEQKMSIPKLKIQGAKPRKTTKRA